MASFAEIATCTSEWRELPKSRKRELRVLAAEGHWPSNGTENVTEDWNSKLGWLVDATTKDDIVVRIPMTLPLDHHECSGCGCPATQNELRRSKWVCLWVADCWARNQFDENGEFNINSEFRLLMVEEAHVMVEFNLCCACWQRAYLAMTTSDHLVKGYAWEGFRHGLRQLMWNNVWKMNKRERMEEEIHKLKETRVAQKAKLAFLKGQHLESPNRRMEEEIRRLKAKVARQQEEIDELEEEDDSDDDEDDDSEEDEE